MVDLEKFRKENCKKNAEGRWLCSRCHAVELDDHQAALCGPCSEKVKQAHQRAQLERQRRQWEESVRGWGNKAFAVLPSWEHLQNPKLFAEKVTDRRVVAIAERWTPSKGSLLLLGPSGSGKTSAMARALIRLRAERVQELLAKPKDQQAASDLDEIARMTWTGALDIYRSLKGHRLGSGEEPEALALAAAAPITVVDDVGQEPDRIAPEIFDLVDRRYARKRPTIITSGLTEPAFVQRYGDAFFRRLTEDGVGFLIDAHPKGARG